MTDAMELRKFAVPEFIFGSGARHLAGQYAQNLGITRALLVTDPGLIKAGWPGQVETSLRESGVDVVTFSTVTPNPKDHEVATGRELYSARGCNGLIAVGGGSPMDCSKGIGILCSNPGTILDYEGIDTIQQPPPPLICLPTTAGTSADVSQFAIITDTTRKSKIAIVSKGLIPDLSLIDPDMTLTMDRELTANTGLDALVHAFEALASNASSSITDLHAKEAIRLIGANLPSVLGQPENLNIRANMALGSLHAGLAFSNASLGAVHAMAHALGGLSDLPHGECNAILLPWIIEYNFYYATDAYDAASAAMGLDVSNTSKSQRLSNLLNTIRKLQSVANIPTGLAQIGVTKNHLPRLAELAMADACMITNPRTPTTPEIQELYEHAL